MFITLTPNPALDRTLTLEQPLAQGQLHRVSHVREVAGGKGVNVARVLKALGAEVTVAGFLAGWNGQKFRALLATEGLHGIFQEVKGETRECHILLNKGHPTEVYERGASVTLGDWRKLAAQLPKGQVIISGSFAPGLEAQELAEVFSLFKVPIVDSGGQVLQTALGEDVLFLKPNQHELAQLVGQDGAGIKEAKDLFQQRGKPLLLTLGQKGAAYIAETCYLAKAPEISVINPVGSGDSFLAGFLWARQLGESVQEALRFAVASGTDNARNGGGGRVTLEGIEALARAVEVRPFYP